MLRALRHPRFALLWTGQTLSRIGDHLFEVALAVWVVQATGSALTMGLVLVFSLGPSVVFSLLGGALADRLPRAGVIVVSDLARGLAAVSVAYVAQQDTLELWHVGAIALFYGVADAIFNPAFFALVPDLVPEEDLPSANSLVSFSVQLGRIAGPALAGVLLAVAGPWVAFLADGLSFVLAGLLALPLVKRVVPDHQADSNAADAGSVGRFKADVAEGLRVVAAAPILWITILVTSVGNVLLFGAYAVALPFYFIDVIAAAELPRFLAAALPGPHVASGERLLGLMYSTFAVGYVVGGLWLGRKARLRRRGRTAFLGLVAAGLGMAAFGLPLPLGVLFLCALANGIGLETFGLMWTNLMQTVVPGDKLGRVASIDNLGSYGLLPLGLLAAGWATDALGVTTVLFGAGAATAGLALVALAQPAILNTD